MNIDEAKRITTEHDALEKLAKRISAFRDGPTTTTVETELSIGDDLLGYLAPLVERRVKDLAALFETATPANPVPAAPTKPATRQKVKPAVVEAFGRGAGDTNDENWKKWADAMGFKWDSVRGVLRELRDPVQMVAMTITSPK